MPEWAEECIDEAIEVLARSGRNDLADDLGRILQKVDLDDLDVLRCPSLDSLANEIIDADTLARLGTLLSRLAEVMGLDHCTLHVVREGPATNFSTMVLTSYSEAWISRYVDRRYAHIDPVAHACAKTERCFFWDSLDRLTPMTRVFWADATDHGVGPSGYTLPLVTERGDKLAVSVCSHVSPEVFREQFNPFEGDLFTLGIFLADAFCRLASDDRPKSFHPTDDQLTILRAIAMGSTESELSDRAYQYGSYATLQRSICALFQTRTVAQAAVLAARIGLLAEAPWTKADIVRAPDGDANATNCVPFRRLVRLRNPA